MPAAVLTCGDSVSMPGGWVLDSPAFPVVARTIRHASGTTASSRTTGGTVVAGGWPPGMPGLMAVGCGRSRCTSPHSSKICRHGILRGDPSAAHGPALLRQAAGPRSDRAHPRVSAASTVRRVLPRLGVPHPHRSRRPSCSRRWTKGWALASSASCPNNCCPATGGRRPDLVLNCEHRMRGSISGPEAPDAGMRRRPRRVAPDRPSSGSTSPRAERLKAFTPITRGELSSSYGRPELRTSLGSRPTARSKAITCEIAACSVSL